MFEGRWVLGLWLAACLFAAGQSVAQVAVQAGTCQKSTFKVALDIGHYKAAPGAISARGITEFTYNHALAELVLAALKAQGFETAFLIGESREPLPLSRRPQIAQEANADLFISLHHDSAQQQYFSEWTYEG